jgi:hypothetical protein
MSGTKKQLVTVSAEELSGKSIMRRLQADIDNIILTINTKIRTAHSMGESALYFEVPDVYLNIGGLAPEEIIDIIYYQVIREFEAAGFQVRIRYEKRMIVVKWLNKLSDEERQIIRRTIIDHLDK